MICQLLVRCHQPNPNSHSSKALFQEPLKRRKRKIPEKQAALASSSNTQWNKRILKDFLMDEVSRHWNVHFGPNTKSSSRSLNAEWWVKCSEQVCQYDSRHLLLWPCEWLPGDGTRLGSSYLTGRLISLFWKRQVVTPAPPAARPWKKDLGF